MNCEHCLKSPPLDSGIARAWHRLAGTAGRTLRWLLASLAQLG